MKKSGGHATNTPVIAAATVGVAAVSSSAGITTDSTVTGTTENTTSEAVSVTVISTAEGNVNSEDNNTSADATDASIKTDGEAMEVDPNAEGSGLVEIKTDEAGTVPVVSMSETGAEITYGELKETVAEESGQDQGTELEQEAVSAAPVAVVVSEAEAMEWRAHFHAACRWFDTDQDKFLRADHLLLILQSSPREVSRADLSSAVWRVCKEQERLRYDSFI